MYGSLTNLKDNKMLKPASLLLLLVCSTASYAWGPREQAALAGFVGGYIIGANAYSYHTPPPPVYYPPVYYSPARVIHNQPYHYVYQPVCWYEYVYDSYGRPMQRYTICRWNVGWQIYFKFASWIWMPKHDSCTSFLAKIPAPDPIRACSCKLTRIA